MKIHMPWGSGLGTLGFTTRWRHVDWYVMNRRLYMFVGRYSGVGHPPVLFEKSWYVLDREGLWPRWRLTHREDRHGDWNRSRGHRPAWVDRPEDTLARARQLGLRFRPYRIVDWYGERLEVISYPCPDRDAIRVMLREPGDPTTMRPVVLEKFLDDERRAAD